VSAGHVVLIGLSGSGKSTVGKSLAARLERDFVDTDDLIVQRAGKSIPDVFRDEGEDAFRAIEREAVADAVARQPAVIATGGGAPVDPENRRRLWDGAAVVWLDAPVEALAQRVGRTGAGRPLLSGDAIGRLTQLRAAREAVYAEAHLRVDTEALGVDGAMQAILRFLESPP
jgi:shikimate kinase